MSLFQATDELLINLDQISAILTGIETSSIKKVNGKLITDNKNRCLYEVKPYIEIYINGSSFTVAGFANIYTLLGTNKYPRVWNALIKKVSIALEGNEDEVGILLSEEDKKYLTRKI